MQRDPLPQSRAISTIPALPLRQVLQRLVLLCMLPLVLLALYLGVDSVRKVRAADDRAAARMASEIGAAVDHALQARIDALSALSRSPLLDSAERLPDFLRAAQSIRATFGGEVILADASGQMLLHTARPVDAALPRLPRPDGNAAAPLALSTGRPAVGNRVMGPVQQRPVVAIAVPVGEARPATRVLMSVVEVQQLQQILDQAALPEGWSLTLLDGVQAMLAERQASEPVDLEGRHVVASRWAPWSLVLASSQRSRMAPLWHAAWALGVAILGASLVGLAAGTLSARRLALAVASLVDTDAPPPGGRPVAEVLAVRERLDASLQHISAATTALRESEATFRAVVHGLPDAAALCDAERRIRLVNPAFERLFGVPAAQAIGRTTAFMYAEQADYEAQGRIRFGADAGTVPALYELRYRRADGSTFWAESVGLRVVDDTGHTLGLFGLHRDITQRKQAADLLEAEVQHRTADLALANSALAARAQTIADLYDRAPCGYFSLDMARRVTEANHTVVALLGHSRDAFVGHTISEFMTPHSRRCMRCASRNCW